MRIGIAIPCYKYHIPVLKRCLDSIEAQTRKPDEVVVSCSSCAESDIPEYKYSFSLKIISTSERKNAAENRNIASSHLDTDIVSFFDCDDEMHPQRLEAIQGAFMRYSCDIVLHGYFTNEENKIPFQIYPELTVFINMLRRYPTGCAFIQGYLTTRIHQSQVSVKKYILSKIRFREDKQSERKEDALFCGDAAAIPGIQSICIENSLSKYYIEGAWY